MRTIAFAVLCLLFPSFAPFEWASEGRQEPDLEKDVARLAERLSDDKIEIRDGARRDLVALGAGALPFIRRRAETAELEIREHLLGVARLGLLLSGKRVVDDVGQYS